MTLILKQAAAIGLLLVLLFATFFSTDTLAQKSTPGLFSEVPGLNNLDTSSDPTVIRSRPVTVDLGQLAGSASQDVGIASGSLGM